MPFNSNFIPIMKHRIIQKAKAMFIETGDGEGLRKAITTSKVKDTIVGLMIVKTTDDIATLSKEHPNIQIRYCLNRTMLHCRTIHDPVPDFLK